MSITVLLHISGEDPILGEMEEMPSPLDRNIMLNSPRKRDGKDLPYVAENVITVIWPMHRVNFVEVLPSREDEKLIGRVRE